MFPVAKGHENLLLNHVNAISTTAERGDYSACYGDIHATLIREELERDKRPWHHSCVMSSESCAAIMWSYQKQVGPHQSFFWYDTDYKET